MKKLHLINAKSLTDIENKHQNKVFPVLEKETLEWAKKCKFEAYSATIELQKEFLKDPNSINVKYFRYLRRLLELKLEQLGSEIGKDPIQLNKELVEFLDIESLNVQEFISCSQVNMYELCPRKYFLRYALGLKFPKTSELFYGTCIDASLNFHFEEKLKGSIPPRSAVYSQFYESFEKEKNNVTWNQIDPQSLYKLGPPVIDAYLNEFDKITNVTGVQTEAVIKLNGGGILKGYLDILEEDAIVDTKTSGKLWETSGPYAKAKTELQPKAYGLWFYEQFNRIPEFRYQIVTKDVDEKGNAKPQTQLIKVEIKKYELESFKLRMEKIWAEIMNLLPKSKEAFKAQADPAMHDQSKPGFGFGKANPSPLCCKKYCEYADICIKDGLPVSLYYDKGKKKHIYEEKNNSSQNS